MGKLSRVLKYTSWSLIAGCGEDDAAQVSLRQSTPLLSESTIDQALAKDYTDARGKHWRYVSAAEPTIGTPEERDLQLVPGLPDIEALLGGSTMRMRMVDGVGYTYVAEGDNRHLAERMRWYEEAIARSRGPQHVDSDRTLESSPPPDAFQGQMVVGTDSRGEIAHPDTDYPWSAIGEGFLSNHQKFCTMFMIGPRTALSAAHCHWSRPSNSWYAMSYFAIGNDNGLTSGISNGHYASFQDDWVVSIPSAFKTSNSWIFYDIAVIEFDNDFGEDETGWLGVDPDPTTSSTFWTVSGYPDSIAASGFSWGEQATHAVEGVYNSSSATWADATVPTWYIYHTIDATSGQSGAAIRQTSSGAPYAISIHSGGFENDDCPGPLDDCNGGPRLGSKWLPFVEDNSSWAPEFWGGTQPHAP